jgi:hypothetical protein
MEMEVQTVANVVPISIAPALYLLHHNNIIVTYPRTSNLRMELVRSIPLYYVASMYAH